MQFGDLGFQFRCMHALLFALPIPLLIALGFSQPDSVDQKRELARVMARRTEMPAAEAKAGQETAGAAPGRKLHSTPKEIGQPRCTGHHQQEREYAGQGELGDA
jgi:hypothetical protein